MDWAVCLFVFLCMLKPGWSNELPGIEAVRRVNIVENSPVGTTVLDFTVSDPDSDTLSVSITWDKIFYLVETARNAYTIKLKEMLDREKETRYSLEITVDDNNGGTYPHVVTVRVLDINDYTPVFRNLPLLAHVRENDLPGTFVLNITAEDEDSGYNQALEFSLLDVSSPFYLGDFATRMPLNHSYSRATVLLQSSLDYESTKVYLVKVKVSDMAGCTGPICQAPLSSNQTMIVNVVDVQDTPPYFTGLPYVVSSEENLPQGSVIMTVSAQDGDSSDPRELEYYFLSESGSTSSTMSHFHLNKLTGEITNTNVLDSDSAELKERNGAFSFTVLAKEKVSSDDTTELSSYSSSILVTITFNDLNDEVPTFSHSSVQATIAENLPIGSPITFNTPLRVIDSDQGLNGTFELKVLQNGSISQYFTVSPARVVNEATVTISSASLLDFERLKQYSLQVVATESSGLSSSTASVTVTVVDANDNSPIFTEEGYTGSVSEADTAGVQVLVSPSIQATDFDSNHYGQVVYSLRGGGGKFAINPTTGAVTVTCDNCLDRESISEYFLNLLAVDGGGLTNTSRLVITLLDANDNSPQFSADVYTAYLNENSQRLLSPVTIQVSDKDIGLNGDVNISIITHSEYFDVYPNGSVYIVKSVDAESVDQVLNVIILATDNGSPALNSTAVLRVTVNDMNDVAPEFVREGPVLNVSENNQIGFPVYVVEASDNDKSSPNHLISYAISSGAYGAFQIDSQSGEIFISELLDAEGARNEYNLSVTATDRGHPQLLAQQNVIIKLTDVNDEKPLLTPDLYSFTVSESTLPGAELGQIFATDLDSTSHLVYRITEFSGETSSGERISELDEMFEIVSTNGTILVSKPLDRESVAKLNLQVEVEDINGVEAQVSSALVIITITDSNDNAPRIQPVEMITLFEMAIGSPVPNTVLVTLSVTDKDASASFEFSISNNPEGTFAINNQGEIRLIKSIDREETGNWINITVVVQDSQINAQSSSMDIPIKIKDINDNKPEFVEFPASIAVAEHKQPTSLLTKVRAVDRDYDPDYRTVQYFIRGAAQAVFNISRTTGQLSVAGDIDRDTDQLTNNTYHAVIEACDRGLPPQCTSRVMLIRIMDINDNSPQFTRSIYRGSVIETSSAGTSITMNGNERIEAVDIDASPNGQNVAYTCCNPTNDSLRLFNVNTLGEIVVGSDGLIGHIGVYNLTVTASDWGATSRFGTATVIVTVQDYNDHAPEIRVEGSDTTTTTIHRPESSAEGSAVVTLVAEDADTGQNGIVDFHFNTDVSNDYQHFLIEQLDDNGKAVIRQKVAFDRENKQSEYMLVIFAMDKGVPSLSSNNVTLTVLVDDVNDNPSYFPESKRTVSFSVTEGQSGVLLGNVNFAVDGDNTQSFCYHVIGGRDTAKSAIASSERLTREQFNLHSRSGDLYLADGWTPDREQQSQIVLVIQVDDRDVNVYDNCQSPPVTHWTHARSADNEMEVVIIIEDIDDSPPKFTPKMLTAAVVRGYPPSTTLLKLQDYASDPDLDQTRTFTRGQTFSYSPSALGAVIDVTEPIKVYSDGEVKSEISFTDNMKGTIRFTVIVLDRNGHEDMANVSILIINPENVAAFTVTLSKSDTEATLMEFIRIFHAIAGWEVNIIELKPNTEHADFTDIHLYVIPNDTSKVNTGEQILQNTNSNPELMKTLQRYGVINTVTTEEAVEGDDNKSPTNTIILVVVVVALVIIVGGIAIVSYVMRKKYKRKLKAAHAMAFDHNDVSQPPSTHITSGSERSSTGSHPTWNKDDMNNFDWGTANSGFDRESNRSAHSIDDNAVDPLNDNQSCSSTGSNDWRLDLRGNNLDTTSPVNPRDVLTSVLSERDALQNQLNSEKMLNHVEISVPPLDDGHFNRLIMSDSGYGKFCETIQLPNGLESTEV